MKRWDPGKSQIAKSIRHHCPLISNFEVISILKRVEIIWDDLNYDGLAYEDLVREAIFLCELDEINPEGRR